MNVAEGGGDKHADGFPSGWYHHSVSFDSLLTGVAITRYAQQRAQWLAAWFESDLLGGLLSELAKVSKSPNRQCSTMWKNYWRD